MLSLLKPIIKKYIPKNIYTKIHQILKPTPKIDLQWNLRSDLEIKLKNFSDWVIYNDIFVDGEYDIPIHEVLNSKPVTRTLNIVDIGANVGFFSLRFIDLLRQGGHTNLQYFITLVEGSPVLTKELNLRLIGQNSLSDKIKIVSGLVGQREGVGRISEIDFTAMNSIFGSDANSVSVDYVNLNSVLENETVIDLLKCDIEGAEQLFLENYTDLMQRVQMAVFELHPHQCDVKRCITLIENAGLIHSKVLRITDGFEVIYFWR